MVASRVRSKVASIKFDEFHQHSVQIIREAVFGLDSNGEANAELDFIRAPPYGCMVLNILTQYPLRPAR